MIQPLEHHLPDFAGDAVKVKFRVEPDADGYPPITSENMWAAGKGPNTLELVSTPIFVRGISLADLFEARPSPDGALEFIRVLSRSRRVSLSVICYNADLEQVRRICAERSLPFEIYTVGGDDSRLVGMSVPPDIDYAAVKRDLEELEHASAGPLFSFAELNLPR